MSVASMPAPPFVQCDDSKRGDVSVFANAGVSADASITLHMRRPDDDAVSILFGDERITLEFYDVESLERLRDLASEGIRRLRASIELNARAGTAAD